MDEPTQFDLVLAQVRRALPAAVWETCNSLNFHGEWELALEHCVFQLAEGDVQISQGVKAALESCAERFHARPSTAIAISSLKAS